MTGLLLPVALFPLGTTHDYAIGQAGPSILSNHPIAGVSGREALAYCDWLTEQLRTSDRTPSALADLLRGGTADGRRWRVTLPSDAEWEKAARGPAPSRRMYPWGDEPDPDAANYNETGIGRTSPVGCFPKGRSASYGILDLGGNVTEWTSGKDQDHMNLDQVDRYESGGGVEYVARRRGVFLGLRGGAFDSLARDVRCAVRSWDRLDFRNHRIGFRVVVSPFDL